MGLGQASPHRCLLAADKASDKEKEKRRGLLLSEVGCVTRPDEEEDEGMRNVMVRRRSQKFIDRDRRRRDADCVKLHLGLNRRE